MPVGGARFDELLGSPRGAPELIDDDAEDDEADQEVQEVDRRQEDSEGKNSLVENPNPIWISLAHSNTFETRNTKPKSMVRNAFVNADRNAPSRAAWTHRATDQELVSRTRVLKTPMRRSSCAWDCRKSSGLCVRTEDVDDEIAGEDERLEEDEGPHVRLAGHEPGSWSCHRCDGSLIDVRAGARRPRGSSSCRSHQAPDRSGCSSAARSGSGPVPKSSRMDHLSEQGDEDARVDDEHDHVDPPRDHAVPGKDAAS